MKFFQLLILTLLFIGCEKKSNEENIQKLYNYNQISGFKADTDKKQLIYEILKRAVVEHKDIPSYNLIMDKKKIYICDKYYSNFRERILKPLKKTEITEKIGDVEFNIKSTLEIQTIANNSNDFLYLTLGDIEIRGNSGKIGLSNDWVVSEKNKGKYGIMSGGGYILNFKKIKGRWTFDNNSENRIWEH